MHPSGQGGIDVGSTERFCDFGYCSDFGGAFTFTCSFAQAEAGAATATTATQEAIVYAARSVD